jgi:predicted Ser/Thr protein kinase
VDESEAVLERLRRIEALDRADARPDEIVGELRALLREAEAWSKREGGESGASAVQDLRDALARDMIER